MLKDIFGCAKHQERAIYGQGYKITLERNKDDAVLNKAEAIAEAKIQIDDVHW